MKIDINADLGEAYGVYRMGPDEALFELISSANVACGFHAGDPLTMRTTVANARARGIDIGAHVGYDDLLHFGRRPLAVDPARLEAETLYQLGALDAIAAASDARLSHLTFHGALGNRLYDDDALAMRLLSAVRQARPGLLLPVAPQTGIARAAARLGLPTITKFFADRAYDGRGVIVPRTHPEAVIHDPQRAAERVVRVLETGRIDTVDGSEVAIAAQSVVIHSDTPGAVALARAVRAAVEAAGGTITPLSRLGAAH